MTQNQKASEFFSSLECILGNTAFEPSDICVAAYQYQAGYVHDKDEHTFNNCMSSPRVITEHISVYGKASSHGLETFE